MKIVIPIAVASVFLAIQGCSQPADQSSERSADEAPAEPAAEDDTGESAMGASEEAEMAEANVSGPCPVVDSRNWQAWVNAMPGPDAQATLVVEGEVDTPTPGYEFSWEAGMADRSAIPMQRLHLKATAPDGMVAQVVTTDSVRYEGPAIAQNYRAVAVMCGEELLAEITEVTTAQ